MSAAPPTRSLRREGPSWTYRGGRFRAPLLLSQLPPELEVTALARLLPTSVRIDLSMEIFRLAPSRSLEILENARAIAAAEMMHGGDDRHARRSELEVEEASARDLGRRVARREEDLWRVGLRFDCLGASRASAERTRDALRRRLTALGFRPRIPAFESWPVSAPSDLSGVQPRPPGYWHTLPTEGLAAFYPFGDESVVEPGGILIGLQLDDASPVFLDRWSQGSYSWGVFGTTGAGKTFATALWLLRTIWMRPETTVIVLDPLGEFRAFGERLGGAVLRLGDPTAPRLNPLDPATTGGDRVEKAGRVGTILHALFPSLRDEERAALDTAVNHLYDRGPEVPTFTDLIAEVDRGPVAVDRLKGLLEVLRTGSLRHLDGPGTLQADRTPVVFDLHGVDASHLPFHLTYLLDWAYGQLRERPGPKLLVIDEAHLLTRDAATAEFLDRLVRHVRHFDAGVVVLSQSPEDFLAFESGRSLLRNLRAILLLRLPQIRPEVRAAFDLTHREVAWLAHARLPKEAGYSEALLRTGPAHLPLGIVASTPEYEWLCGTLGRDGAPPLDPPEGPPRAGPSPRL